MLSSGSSLNFCVVVALCSLGQLVMIEKQPIETVERCVTHLSLLLCGVLAIAMALESRKHGFKSH